MSFLAQGLVELIFGGLTGYITNDIAIKSLFKSGGVVEETRDDFTREISQLLEKEIITNEEIVAKLNSSEVRQGIKILLDEYIQQQLLQELSQYQLDQLDEGQQLLMNLEDLLLSTGTSHQKLLEHIVNRIDIGKIFTEEQLTKMIKKLVHLIVESINEQSISADVAQRIQQDKELISLKMLGGGSIFSQLADNGKKLSGQFCEHLLTHHQDQLVNLTMNVAERIDIKGLLNTLEQKIKQLPLDELLLIQPGQLITQVKGYFASDDGAELILVISEEILAMAKDLEITVGELIPENFVHRFSPMVQRHMPILVQMLIVWLEQNKGQLEQSLEGAIDEVLDVEEGTKGFLLQVIRNGVLDNIAEKFKVVEKLGSLLDEALGKPDTMDLIGEKIGSYLANKPLKELIDHLEKMEIDCRGLIGQFIAQNLSFYLSHIEINKVGQFLEKSVGQVYTHSFVETYYDQYSQRIIDKQITNMREHGAAKQWINQAIDHKIDSILNTPISQYGIWQKDLSYYTGWDQQVIGYIESQQLQVAKYLHQRLSQERAWELIQKINKDNFILTPLIHGAVVKLGEANVGELYQQTVIHWYEKYGHQKIDSYSLQPPNWSDGLLAQLAEENMNQLSEEQVLDLVQDFMGKELKPLNYLGAALGGIAGLGAGLMLPDLSIAYTEGILGTSTLIGIKAFIFGAVGYGTNWAAIKGLFWPYQPLWGQSYLQGVIPKRQQGFAENMGKMIEETLLNQQYLASKLEEKRDAILAYGVNYLDSITTQEWIEEQIANHSVQWTKLLLEQQEIIINQGIDYSFNYLEQNKLGGISEEILTYWAKELIERLKNQLPHHLAKLGDETKSIEPLINQDWAIDQLTEGLITLVEQIELKQVREYVKAEVNHWKNQQIRQILSEDWALNNVKNWCANRLNSQELAYAMYAGYQVLEQEYTLGELIGNRIEEILLNRTELIFNFIIGEVNVYLQQHQSQLTEQIQQEIEGQLGFMQLLGYQALNGPQLIHDIVIKVIDEKVPQFLYSNQRELIGVIVEFWVEHLQHNTLKDLELNIVEDDFIHLMDTVTAHVSLERGIERIFIPLWAKVNPLPLHQILTFMNADEELKAVMPLIDEMWEAIVIQMKERKPLIERALSEQGWPIIGDGLKEIGYHQILQDITIEHWQKINWSKVMELAQLESVVQQKVKFIQGKMENDTFTQWVDEQQLRESIDNNVMPILAGEQGKELWVVLSQSFMDGLANVLPEETKSQLITVMINCGVDTVAQHSSTIISQIGLGEIAVEQIKKMNPEELEDMVRGFADPYFTHIKNKGWLGAAFSLPGIIINLLL